MSDQKQIDGEDLKAPSEYLKERVRALRPAVQGAVKLLRNEGARSEIFFRRSLQ